MRPLHIVCAFFLLASCGTRSNLDLRFHDSRSMADPTFTVSLADPSSFSFAIVGDTHVGGDTIRLNTILTQAASAGDSFVVLLGDIVDAGLRKDMESVKAAVDGSAFAGKVIYAIGNHDVFEDGWTHYKSVLGSSVYSVTFGNSKFIILDSADATIGRQQYEWIESELREPNATNTFFLSHYLPYVPHQRTYLRLSDEVEAARLMKLAASHRVKGWLGGHYHSFGDEDVEGVKYVVAGGAGGRRMEPVKSFFYVQMVVNGEQVTANLRVIP